MNLSQSKFSLNDVYLSHMQDCMTIFSWFKQKQILIQDILRKQAFDIASRLAYYMVTLYNKVR